MSTFIQIDKVENYYYPKLFKELFKMYGTLLLLHRLNYSELNSLFHSHYFIFYISVFFLLIFNETKKKVTIWFIAICFFFSFSVLLFLVIIDCKGCTLVSAIKFQPNIVIASREWFCIGWFTFRTQSRWSTTVTWNGRNMRWVSISWRYQQFMEQIKCKEASKTTRIAIG